MINFVDRVPVNVGQYTMTQNGETSTITLTRDDGAIIPGTPINRANMLAVQGFIGCTTTISESGGVTTITETNSESDVLTTTISESGGVTTITAVFTGADGSTATKTTTISESGGVTTITEVLS